MRAMLKDGLLILVVETAEDSAEFSQWRAQVDRHVFHLAGGSDKGCALHDMGPREDACREPINVVYDQVDVHWRPISNLAYSPFSLGGRDYASVEGFWQSLRYEDPAEKGRVGALWGLDAKNAAREASKASVFSYDGRDHAVGGPEHRALMLEACRAKFGQDAAARAALLSTADRPLTHRVRRDSVTIPGALMADIWMRLRRSIRKAETAV